MDMANITTKEDVAVTVRHAIEQELKSRGFQAGADAAVTITADITSFRNQFKSGLWTGHSIANLDMNVTVKSKNGDLLFTKQIAEKNDEHVGLATDENAKISLDKALSGAMQTLFNDKAFIAALLASTTTN